MKLRFKDRLKNLVSAFDEEPFCGNIAQIRFSPYKKNEESQSLFSTGASFTNRTTFSPAMNYDLIQHKENDFRTVDHSISLLQQKILTKAKNSLITSRIAYTQADHPTVKNKFQRKLIQLNHECFNQAGRAYYMNKPIVRLNQPLYSTKTIGQTLEINSPSKRGLSGKKQICDLSELTDQKPGDKNISTNFKSKFLNLQPKMNRIDNRLNSLFKKENSKPKERNPHNLFKNFHTGMNLIRSNAFLNKNH